MEQLGQDDPQSFKRLIWAMALMGVIFVGMSYFMRPKNNPAPVKGGQAVRIGHEAARARG